MKHILLTALLLGSATVLPAQEQSLLTLEEALSIAMTDNPSIQALEHEEQAARQERKAAIGLRMPQISVAGAYAYLGKDIGLDANGLKPTVNGAIDQLIPYLPADILPVVGQLTAPIMGADWGYTIQDRSLGFVGGEVTLPIWMGGKINAANRVAKINERSAEAQGDQTRNALISELVERYFGVALAKQVVQVRQQVVDGVRLHLKDAVAMEQSGMLARADLLYVEFKMEEAERELSNARLELQTIEAALANTLGRDTGGDPVTAMFVLHDAEPLEYYREAAARNNPMLNQVALKRELAHENVRVQRAEFLPQVVAVGGASFYNYQVTDLLPRWAVGVGVSLKLFNGLNREYKYSAARQTEQRVAKLEEKASDDIGVLVEKLYNQMLHYGNQLSSIDASLAFAEAYLKTQEASFREGVGSSSDLIDAELNLAKVRAERLQAAYRYDVLLAQLLEAAGMSSAFPEYARRSDAEPIVFNR